MAWAKKVEIDAAATAGGREMLALQQEMLALMQTHRE